MLRAGLVLCLTLVPLACSSPKPPPPAPIAPVEPPSKKADPDVEELLQEEPEPAAPSPEEVKKAEEAKRLEKDWAEMEEEARVENERWTEALHAEAKALAAASYPSTRAGLQKILEGKHRKPESAARDGDRHPIETLEAFGLKPNMTVLEYGPGEGWYTELLAPLLAKKGKLIVTTTDPNGPREARPTLYAKRTALFLDKAPELYGKVERQMFSPDKPDLGADASVDLVLVMRGMHGWQRNGTTAAWLAEVHRVLKPKGILGIEQHRAKEGSSADETAKQGYLPEAWVIEQVEAAGFKLASKSEVNANPKDTRDHPEGVWTLPPTLRLGDTDKDKYLAIGESDRMTLKFVKVDKK